MILYSYEFYRQGATDSGFWVSPGCAGRCVWGGDGLRRVFALGLEGGCWFLVYIGAGRHNRA
eukprot:3231704-Lingulodinium_polyedra.AAC.1